MASHGVTRASVTGVRSEESRQKELRQITAYKELVELVNAKIVERQYTLDVLSLITKLLNENPEYYTIWNHRRRVLGAIIASPTSEQALQSSHEKSGEDLINGDLQLTFALLRKFPKCYWIWNHRNWILGTAETLLDTQSAYKLWSGELQLIGKMLHADSRNFHAWSYRRDVIAQLERLQLSLSESGLATSESFPNLTESEFEYTTKLIKTNLSNFSAWHHRSKAIPSLLHQRGSDSIARRKLFDEELALICTAINTDPFDQSIWYYHQYLMSTLSPECPQRSKVVLDLTNHDRQKYYFHELEYIQEILEDEEDCKWIYESLLSLAVAYLEVEGGTQAFSTQDMRSWLQHLKRLDPLRNGRWEELGTSLNI